MISPKSRASPNSSPGRLKNFLCIALLGLTLLGASSCSWFSDDDDKTPSRDPLAKNAQAAQQAAGKSNLTEPDGNAMQPPMGLNTSPRLFDKKLHSDDDRFDRLEAAVQSMRDEIDGLEPSIKKLQGVQGDMQQLVTQLQTLTKASSEITPSQLNNDQGAINKAMGVTPEADEPPPPPPAPVAAPHPAAAKSKPAVAVASAKAVSSGDMSLAAVRLADNGTKTRLVLETAGSLPYKADLDNDEHILTLTFSKGTMGVDVSKLALHSKIIKSASGTAQNAGGFVLAFTLNKNSKLLNQGVIAPDKDNPHTRIWIDLAN